MSYEFVDTVSSDEPNENTIVEGLNFGSFDSREHGLWLVSRDAPTPSEKEITETVPLMQGVYDFSQFENERYFDRRTITYKIQAVGHGYNDRKNLEQEIKRQLMPLGVQQLYDSHDRGYHWLGKCQSVTVEDDQQYQKLVATVVFICYPFAIYNEAEGSDIWDDVYFPHWIFQETKYTVNGSQSISLFNIGSRSVECEMVVTGDITVIGDFGSVELTSGDYQDTQIVLAMGENNLILSGNGTIEFKFYREEMI